MVLKLKTDPEQAKSHKTDQLSPSNFGSREATCRVALATGHFLAEAQGVNNPREATAVLGGRLVVWRQRLLLCTDKGRRPVALKLSLCCCEKI
ncbi:unnamed protein product [Prunus armeniaca]